MSIVIPKIRDKERTKGKILSAVGEIIEQHGIEKVGVNLVARTAGTNKVLIYRYFDTVDGLIQEYIKKSGLQVFTSSSELLNIDNSELQMKAKDFTGLMLAMLHDLRNNKQMRNLLRWEMQSGTSTLPDIHKKAAERIMQKLGQLPGDQDVGALFTILTAGIYYLTIASDHQDKVIDIDLRSEQGWKRVENIIEKIIVDTVF